MAIVSISRGSYSLGSEIATRVAAELGYRCLSREVLLEASKEFNVPEVDLSHAIEAPPSLLDRLTNGRARYVAFIRSTLLRHFCADEIVYHGLAGHFFVQGVQHVAKVRVVADMDYRVGVVVEREGIDADEARAQLQRSDEARRQWTTSLYGVDPEDTSLYHLFIHVGKVGLDGAVTMICDFARQERFRTTTESQAALDDLAIAAEVEARLADMESAPSQFEVTANQGEVQVLLHSGPRILGGSDRSFRTHYVDTLQHDLYQRVRKLRGLKHLTVHFAED